MKKWDGKSRGNSLGYSIFIFVIGVNINIAYVLLRFVTLFYYFFSSKKNIRYYFREIHHYNWLKTQKAIYQNYCNLGEMIIDKIAASSSDKTLFTFSLDGKDLLEKTARKGQGALLLGAHMGNWEIASSLLNDFGVKVNIVLYNANDAKIKQTLDKVQAHENINIITIDDDFSHLIKIKEAFARNEFVVMHGDRFIAESTTVTVPFMGQEAKFPVGPMYLALSNQVPLLFVFTLKQSRKHYQFYAKGGNVYHCANGRKQKRIIMNDMVLDYVEHLQKMLIKYPLQWFNYYDFWEEEKENPIKKQY